jgi:hypothetical protein
MRKLVGVALNSYPGLVVNIETPGVAPIIDLASLKYHI